MIDHIHSNRILELSFNTLSRQSGAYTVKQCSLSDYISELIKDPNIPFAYKNMSLFASASIDMWERAIHSFLWSIALTEESPIWSSTMGYYSSHYTMRAFAHSFGFFKSFSGRKVIQIIIQKGHPVFLILDNNKKGEHAFYWSVVKQYPDFTNNPIFKFNGEKDPTSECAHRNHANYADHLNGFHKFGLPSYQEFDKRISSIMSKSLSSLEPIINRVNYPADLVNVQILAYHRIVAFRDFIDDHITNNQFWKARKTPSWYNLDFNPIDEERSIAKERLPI